MAPFFVIFTPTVSNPKFCHTFKQKETLARGAYNLSIRSNPSKETTPHKAPTDKHEHKLRNHNYKYNGNCNNGDKDDDHDNNTNDNNL